MIFELIAVISQWAIDAINFLGYLGVFFLMFLESANIPIPSEVIMPFSGFLSFKGNFSFWIVVIFGTLGNLAGSLVSYFLSSWILKIREKSRLVKFIISENFIVKSKEWFEKYGSFSVFFSRLLPVIRTFISFPAGLGKMNLLKFSILTTAGSFIWSLFLTYIGFIMGENWMSIEKYFRKFDLVILIVIIILGIYWAKRHFNVKIFKKYEKTNDI